MFSNHRVLLLVSFSFLAIFTITGCGGGVQTTQPNPSGFTNASLNGTYVFAITGTNGGGFFTVAGSFNANGSGNITGGVEDINSPGTGLVTQNVSISGSYTVRTDGRTVATINSTSLNPSVTFQLDFVLLNSSKGLLIRFDQNGAASGSIDLQNSAAASLSALAGSFAFNVSGVDSNNPNAQGSESSVGLVTFDTSGNITGGQLDVNDNGMVNGSNSFGVAAASITPASAAVSAPTNGRGTATITTSGTVALTLHFAYYVIDSNHLKLIETDSFPILSGDAFRQTSSSVSGNFVFTLAGATATGHGVFVAGGVLNTDGAGNILNTSVEDVDNGGSVSSGGVAVSGTYTLSGGRGTMQINGPVILNLVFYPSTGGLQLLDVDAANLEAAGAALPQSGSFSNSSLNSGYGLNFTGVVAPGTINASEIDAIAQFNANGSGTVTGALDVNNFGAVSSSLALNGSYAVTANGRGTTSLRSSQGTMNLIFYMANNSQVVFVELDEAFGQIAVGTFAAQ